MAEKIKRTPEDKKYRSEIAQTLRTLRKSWSKDLAGTFLEREKNKDDYKDSKRLNVEVRNEIRDLTDDEIKEVLRFIDNLKSKHEIAKPKSWPKWGCPKCNAIDHEPGARFCHKCWTPLNATDEKNREQPKPKIEQPKPMIEQQKIENSTHLEEEEEKTEEKQRRMPEQLYIPFDFGEASETRDNEE